MGCSLSDTKRNQNLKKHAYHYQVSIHWKPETVFDPIGPPRNPKETANNKDERDKQKLLDHDTKYNSFKN